MSNENVDSVSLHQNIIMRPENLVASAEVETMERLIVGSEGMNSICYESFATNHLMYQLFQEAITNATDNYQKSKEAKVDAGIIKVTVTPSTVTVWNTGLAMSCDYLKEKGMYNPHCALFTLLSSTNYKKNAKSTTGGRNGVGGTCCSIFSSRSRVTIHNVVSGIHYTQGSSRNMFDVEEPEVTQFKPSKTEKSWFQFEYDLDFETVFNNKGKLPKDQVPTEYSDQMIRLLARIAMDAAASTGAIVQFNGHKYSFPTLKHYGDLVMKSLMPDLKLKKNQVISMEMEEFETCFVVYDTPLRGCRFAFCNGIPNAKGGSHVEKLIKDRLDPIFKKAAPKVGCTPAKIKNNVTVFISCRIPVDDISYDGQRKETLIAPTFNFTFSKEEKEKLQAQVASWNAISVIGNMKDEILMKDLYKDIHETNTNKNNYSSVDGCIDAAHVNKKGSQCKLIICEGLTTVDAIVKGIDTKTHGVLPIRGKILNTSKSGKTEDGLDKKFLNKVIMSIMKSMGLSPTLDYSNEANVNKLRYKQVYIMTDADPDGDHIKILICNLFRSTFPDLFKRPGFITVCYTPLVKVTFPRSKGSTKKDPMFFFDIDSYHRWKGDDNEETKHKPHYFKGLGSNGDENIAEMHDNMKRETYMYDEMTEPIMQLTMDKGNENKRKQWIANYRAQGPSFINDSDMYVEGTYSKFLAETMLRYCTTAVDRHIPSIVDGLKPCQRKIFWTALKNTKPNEDTSSLFFMGDVMKSTVYRHGDGALYGAITAMISTYMGLNNYPLIAGRGQFGSVGNPKPSPARYTYCRISEFGSTLMPKDFECMLEDQWEGSLKIEPKNLFFPIPMWAVNGSEGVSIGWKTSIPCYNIQHIIHWIKVFLIKKTSSKEGEELEYPIIEPEFKYFDGILRKVTASNRINGYYYVTEGSFTIGSKEKGSVTITGFPLGVTCKSYLKRLNKKMLSYKGKDKSLTYMNNMESVRSNNKKRVQIDIKPQIQIEGHEEPLTLETLGLRTTIDPSNLVLIDEDGAVLTFTCIHDAMEYWAKIMYQKYDQLKQLMIKKLEQDLDHLTAKAKFICAIRDGDITFSMFKGLNSRQIKDMLLERGYSDEFVTITVLQTMDEPYNKLLQTVQQFEEKLSYYKDCTVMEMWFKHIQELQL